MSDLAILASFLAIFICTVTNLGQSDNKSASRSMGIVLLSLLLIASKYVPASYALPMTPKVNKI